MRYVTNKMMSNKNDYDAQKTFFFAKLEAKSNSRNILFLAIIGTNTHTQKKTVPNNHSPEKR